MGAPIEYAKPSSDVSSDGIIIPDPTFIYVIVDKDKSSVDCIKGTYSSSKSAIKDMGFDYEEGKDLFTDYGNTHLIINQQILK
jgi:hypothetical protein